ncbi:MAG: hypothetical protein GKR91_17635 [Pseudomonadales bacterium]|nr:hypothetical protein [Pseudomonadales bacterium]
MRNLASSAKSIVVLSILLAGLASYSQSNPDYEVPMTEYGHPDLQGLWSDRSRTPLERPGNLGSKRAYTEQEIAELVQSAERGAERASQPIDPNRGAPPLGETITNQPDANFNGFITDYIPVNGEYLTSRIVSTENGRLPFRDSVPMDIFAKRRAAGFEEFDGPENRPANERCLGIPGQLPLVVPLPIDGPWRNMQIVQNRDYVLIYGEYHVTARVVRLNGNHHEPAYPKFYGDSIGYWEGSTLVVHTKSFKPDQSDRRMPSSTALEIIERFTPVSESEMVFEYEITDPEIYLEPFTVRLTLQRMPADQKLYESGCHEGNYSLPSILAGARRQEADARANR